MLRYLIEGTNVKNQKDFVPKYKLQNPNDMQKFLKKRKGKDDCGNNSLHYAFEISHREDRHKFLELLIKEDVGDL